MSDDETTLAELREIVRGFVDQREWQKFHSPKNISMALAIEAAELMEHFQWISMDDSRQVGEDPDKLHAVGEELADVLCYALALSNALNIDVAATVKAKMLRNEKKYPAEEYRGRFRKEDPEADHS
jgi:NTP pyrophosphatase (non-canonical NTP hydrolase)